MPATSTSRPLVRRTALSIGLTALAVGTAACSSGTPAPSASTIPTPSGATSSSIPTSIPTSEASTSTTSNPATTTPTTSAPQTSGPAPSCADRIVEHLSPAERAGQLLMVGLDANAGRTSLDALVAQRHLGGVILLGGWYDGTASVRRTTGHLASLASEQATGGLGLFLAADQEGGAVQQLRGTGFTRMPSARVQDELSPSQLAARATDWAGELKAAGINVNLAPVADTVPTDIGRDNDPIGQYDRQFSSDPVDNARMVGGFIKGMHNGGVAATVKHFPGLGRITGNTDVTSTGITDRTTTTSDPYLAPFQKGINDGVDFVMVGSAIYSRIDPGVNAVFSKPIITDLLRRTMGYDGVVITDDVGAAKAVAATSVADRATKFIVAGGDIVLTARPDTIPAMHSAITARMKSDPAFQELVTAAATRVVNLKIDRGLATC